MPEPEGALESSMPPLLFTPILQTVLAQLPAGTAIAATDGPINPFFSQVAFLWT